MSVPPPDQPPIVSPPRPGAGEPPPARRLTRQLDGRLLGGVANGLAVYLGVDVVVIRIAFVVLSFVPFPGFGVLAYVAMLLLVPTSDGAGAVAANRFADRSAGFWVGLGLITLATFALLGASGPWFAGYGGGVNLLPLLLIGLGVALWVDADRRSGGRGATANGVDTAPTAGTPPVRASTPAGTTTAAPAGSTAGPGVDVGEEGRGAATGSEVPPTPPPRRRVRSPLGRLTVGLALFAGGAVWLLDLTGLVAVPAASILATVLVVLGLGLLVGSVVGRARWLAILVAFLLPITAAVTVLDTLGIDVSGGVDDRTVAVTDPAQLDDPIRLGAGQLTVDLTGLAAGGGVLDVSLGAGELRLLVPEGAGVQGSARLEVGQLDLVDSRSSGISIDRLIDLPAGPGQPTFAVDLRVGAGAIEVRRVPSAQEAVPQDGVDDSSTSDELEDEEVLR